MDEDGCCYRTEEGGRILRCAVGCLITDRVYEKHASLIEGKLATSDDVIDALEECGIPIEHADFLEELQNIHDNIEPDWWAKGLIGIAKGHGLTVPDFLETVPA
jgi:hypothetical protein